MIQDLQTLRQRQQNAKTRPCLIRGRPLTRRLRARQHFPNSLEISRLFGVWEKVEYPVPLREAAFVFQAQGRFDKALRYANKSCQRAERFKARYEYAQSALVCAELQSKLGRANAEQEIKRAKDELAPFREVVFGAKPS